MPTNDKNTAYDEDIEIQVFPRGMWHVIGAVVCMAVSLAILLVLIALLISPWVSVRAVLVTGLFLLVVAVFSLVTPTFLLTRGGAKWYGFLKQLNLYVVGLLAIAGVASMFVGASNLSGTAAIGLFFSLIAFWLYRTGAHAECVDYYRRIWQYRREQIHG